MFKAKTYGRPVAKRVHPGKYHAEFEAVHEFNASEHANMLLEYDQPGGARNAYNNVKKYIEQTRMPLEVKIRNKVFVVVERSEKDADDRG